ncbi:carboxylesterase family protein [Amycolatopsis sp. NPDC051373]|uniref:carboxylesterase family protein n=1 Tax=Amycolatopsis sp. NPDC051373 TaxID=3155801 RepID=UPI00344DF071
MGAAHGAELPYLFDGSFAGPRTAPPSPAQFALPHTLISYWTSFAKTGNPKATDLRHGPYIEQQHRYHPCPRTARGKSISRPNITVRSGKP